MAFLYMHLYCFSLNSSLSTFHLGWRMPLQSFQAGRSAAYAMWSILRPVALACSIFNKVPDVRKVC